MSTIGRNKKYTTVVSRSNDKQESVSLIGEPYYMPVNISPANSKRGSALRLDSELKVKQPTDSPTSSKKSLERSKLKLEDSELKVRTRQDKGTETKVKGKKFEGCVMQTLPYDVYAEPRTKSKTELTYKEFMSQECTQKQSERLKELKREQGQNDDNAEVLGIPLPFRAVGERSSLTNLHNLLKQCPQPQPPLVNKQLRTLQLNAEQAYIMAEQVRKMKMGMERLQEIIKKFNCTERFKQDIDFILANVGPAVARAEQMRKEKMKQAQ